MSGDDDEKVIRGKTEASGSEITKHRQMLQAIEYYCGLKYGQSYLKGTAEPGWQHFTSQIDLIQRVSSKYKVDQTILN